MSYEVVLAVSIWLNAIGENFGKVKSLLASTGPNLVFIVSTVLKLPEAGRLSRRLWQY